MLGYNKFKERTLQAGDKVKCYFDLHAKTFSIQVGNLVHGKSDIVRLSNCEFYVNEAGRQRVLAEKRKNVHAKVLGTLEPIGNIENLKGYRVASYNPYKGAKFFDKVTNEPLYMADEVLLINKVIYYK